MHFLNTEIDPAALPAVEDLNLRPVSPSYLKVLRTEWLIYAFVLAGIAAGLIFLVPGMRENYLWLVIVAAWILLVAFYRVAIERSFPYRAYSVREHDIIYRSGWILRTVKINPINRILNCSIHIGPLERKHGLATLALYNAGTSDADMRIPGLTAEEAESIRKFVLTRINEEDRSH